MVKNPPLFMTIRRLFAGEIFTLGSNLENETSRIFMQIAG
jgi:hypothetical protein